MSRSKIKTQMEKALWRDDYTCRCCGFHAQKFQRVMPFEQDRHSENGFVTVCSFCEQCFALDRAGLSGAGLLIWLPEIEQADLHHIARAIYVARASGHSLSAQAEKAYDALVSRRTEVKKRLGSDDPLLLATVMYESLSDAEYAASQSKLDGIRLLPYDRYLVRTRAGDVNQFPAVVRYWRSAEGPFGNLPVEKWGALFDSVAKTLA